MIKFGSIVQLRNIVKQVEYDVKHTFIDGEDVFDHSIKLPEIEFDATVKIHGTNASVVYNKDGSYYVQSRNRIISVNDDNAGFAKFVDDNKTFLLDVLKQNIHDNDTIVVYGEWAGKGIQSKVAVSEVERFFALFDIKLFKDKKHVYVDNNQYKQVLNSFTNKDSNIFSIYEFDNYVFNIDFENIEKSQNQIVSKVLEIEDCCPVGKYFGVVGVGEGLVLKSKCGKYIFKAKGEKHSASKVKAISAVDIEEIENIKNFVSYAVTENRLNQGVDYLKEMKIDIDMKNIGQFIKWVVSDVFKEENDTINAHGFNDKKVTKEISNVAKSWYIKNCFTF